MDVTTKSVLLPTPAISPAAPKVESWQRNSVIVHILPCCKKGSSEFTIISGKMLKNRFYGRMFLESRFMKLEGKMVEQSH